MSDRYSFTTTPQDDYILRVVDEAAEDTDFIFLTERNTLTGRGFTAEVVVRKNILPAAIFDSNLTLAGRSLGDIFADILSEDLKLESMDDASEWFVLTITGDPDDIDGELERIRNEVRRIKNIKEGRVVRVSVESF